MKNKLKRHIIITIPIRDFVITLVIILIITIGVYTFLDSYTFNGIIYPSYMSVKTSCNTKNQSIEAMQDYANQRGFVLQGSYNPNNNKITIINETINSQKKKTEVIKHEIIHRKQTEEGRSYNCEWTREIEIKPLNITTSLTIQTQTFMFLNEIEAYKGQTLPDPKFTAEYGEIKA